MHLIIPYIQFMFNIYNFKKLLTTAIKVIVSNFVEIAFWNFSKVLNRHKMWARIHSIIYNINIWENVLKYSTCMYTKLNLKCRYILKAQLLARSKKVNFRHMYYIFHFVAICSNFTNCILFLFISVSDNRQT